MARWYYFQTETKGAITKLKISVGWTVDKFWLNNSLAINGTIMRFAYRKINVQRRTFTSFGDFCCSYHQIIAIWILVSEGRDKKVGFVETNLSENSISRSKMQGIFESHFAGHTIHEQNKTQVYLNNLSANKVGCKLCT